jgi:putative endonuclease
MYFVYLLESKIDSGWYVGFTPDSPFRRLVKHNNKEVYWTKRKAPWRLIYFEAYLSEKDATGREKFLKSGAGHKFLKKQLLNYLVKV